MAREELTARGIDIIDLTESNPTRCGFNFLSEDILSPLPDPQNLLYEPSSKGIREARKAISGYYKQRLSSINPEEIIITSGTSEAYAFLFRLLADPNQRVLIPMPSYPLLDYLADLNDVRLDRYPLAYRDAWHIDIARLEKMIRPEHRAIVVIHPNNPTGNYVSAEEKERLNRLCQKHSLALIADEVFLDFKHPNNTNAFESFAGNEAVLTFTLSGISKLLGLPQMKLSWIACCGPKKQRKEAVSRLEIIADTYLSAGTPPQRALSKWLKSQNTIHEEITKRITENLTFLKKHLEQTGAAELLVSEGGWNAVVRLPEGQNDEAQAMAFLKENHVFVHPGYLFDFEEERAIVLSLLVPPDRFREAIGRIFVPRAAMRR